MKVLDQAAGRDWTLLNADCVEAMAEMPAACVDFSVYSPPFSSLYIYSESERDMGNVANDAAFQACYRAAVREKFRLTKPGRLTAIHVKDLVYYSNASARGDRGLRDFTGDCIRTHLAEGWSFHTRITIWRDPVKEQRKSKPDGLLFKNFKADAARCRVGMPEYMIVFRKWGDGMDEATPIVHDEREFPLSIWQQWASPVWLDTRETDVLNAKIARDDEAEKHLCPMPLDLSERSIRLWSNPGDVVLSPFAGVGSEGWSALKAQRRFVGIELKDAYFRQAAKYLAEAEASASDGLFGAARAAE